MMKNFELQQNQSRAANAYQPTQRQALTSIIDNRPTAVRQCKIQEIATIAVNRPIQRQAVGQATAQFTKRKGIKRILHAMRHPFRAYKNKDRSSVSTDFDTDDMSWVNEMKKQAKPVAPGMTHSVEAMNHKQAAAFIGQLEEWLQYVNQILDSHKEDWEQSKVAKLKLNQQAYYDGEHDDFRQSHKDKMRLLSDCEGAKNEIIALLTDLRNEKERQYLVAEKDGQLQGILQTIDLKRDHISNIAVNPANIVPREGEQPVKNTLRDLLQPVVQTNLVNNTEVELFALSTRVKKIYAHYGFLVDKKAKRPNVNRNSRKWRTFSGKLQTDQIKESHAWFDSQQMGMSTSSQQQFIQTYYS